MLIPSRCANPHVTQFVTPLPDDYTVDGTCDYANAVRGIDRQLYMRWKTYSVQTRIGSPTFRIRVARLRVCYLWQLTGDDAVRQGYTGGCGVENRVAMLNDWMGKHAGEWLSEMAKRGIIIDSYPPALCPRIRDWRVLVVDYVRSE